jgi:hypothetical protein
MISIVLTFGATILLFTLKLGIIFVILAMLPTVVAYFMDTTPGKQLTRAIGVCNLAGALPWLLPMMKSGIRLERIEIIPLMTNPKAWIIIYGAAIGGWFLVFLCRFIARFLVVVFLEYKIVSLERFQQKLLEEWGQQIRQK